MKRQDLRRLLVFLGDLVTAVSLLLVAPLDLKGILSCRIYAMWGRLTLALAEVRPHILGSDRISGRKAFFVGNHISGLDPHILLAALDGSVRFLAKRELFSIPVIGRALRTSGNVPIDRANPRATKMALDEMTRTLTQRPWSMAVFPEGTRSKDGRLKPFRRGVFRLLKKAGMTIVPFSVTGIQDDLGPDATRRATLIFGTPIDGSRAADMSTDELMASIREEIRGLSEAAARLNAAGSVEAMSVSPAAPSP